MFPSMSSTVELVSRYDQDCLYLVVLLLIRGFRGLGRSGCFVLLHLKFSAMPVRDWTLRPSGRGYRLRSGLS